MIDVLRGYALILVAMVPAAFVAVGVVASARPEDVIGAGLTYFALHVLGFGVGGYLAARTLKTKRFLLAGLLILLAYPTYSVLLLGVFALFGTLDEGPIEVLVWLAPFAMGLGLLGSALGSARSNVT